MSEVAEKGSDDVVSEAPPSAESIEFTIVFGKSSQSAIRPADSTIGELKAEVEARLQIPQAQMKLLCAGKALKEDAMSLRQFGLKKGSKVMLLGTKWVPDTAWVMFLP